jgi:hypothetical protein
MHQVALFLQMDKMHERDYFTDCFERLNGDFRAIEAIVEEIKEKGAGNVAHPALQSFLAGQGAIGGGYKKIDSWQEKA